MCESKAPAASGRHMVFKSELSKKRAEAAACRKDRQPATSAHSAISGRHALLLAVPATNDSTRAWRPSKLDAERSRELLGLQYDVPWSVWGGQWASSTDTLTGMLVKYRQRKFLLKFPHANNTEPVWLTWGQVLGEQALCGAVFLRPHETVTAPVMEPPKRRHPPEAADCWDMRRGCFVRCDGVAIICRRVSRYR